MRKVYSIVLLTFILAALFGLLALPTFASEAKAPTQSSYVAQLSASPQITFTSVSTVYLPIVVKPVNSFSIISLDYSSHDETVTIRNNGPSPQLFNGWQLVSVRGTQTYPFPNGIILAAGQTLRIHSGPDAFGNPPTDLFWTKEFYWNNDGDKAELRDNQGFVRASFCYLAGCP